MQRRDVQDAVSHSALVMKFGDKDYKIEPLRRRDSREWKKKVAEVTAQIVGHMSPEPPENATGEQLNSWLKNSFSGEVLFALASHPDSIAELLKAYAPLVITEEVLDDATQEQIHIAYGQIMAVEHPFFTTVGALKEMMTAGNLSTSPAPRFTN